MLHCWTGTLPHGNVPDIQVAVRLAQGTPPSLECADRPLPAQLADMLRTGLNADPEQRPTVQAMLRSLSRARTPFAATGSQRAC